MGKTSYSTRGEPTVAQILDTSVDVTTLTSGDGLIYDTVSKLWKNVPVGGGGGGASILGTDDAVVFKNGINGDAPNTGITKVPATAGYTMNLDTTNKRVGINKTSPSTTLDVGGVGRFSNGGDTLNIDGDLTGLVVGTNSLKLYSHNLSTIGDGLTEVNSNTKVVSSSGLVSKDPRTFDTPNGTPDNAFYKIKLRRGLNQQPPGHPLWDEQYTFDPSQTQFPTGQIVEYYDTLPLNFNRIIGRTATGASIAPANVYTISNFGSSFSFQDRCIYDPCMMRSRKIGSGWVYAGAPTQYRVEDIRAMLKVRWYFEGRWISSNPANRIDMYVNQYRNGALFRAFLVGVSNNADTCFMSGERNFLGYANLGEDIDWGQDDFQVEIANMGSFDVTVDLAQVEMEWILAQ